MTCRIERPAVKEQYKPVTSGYELHSLEQAGKFEREGIASDGLESTLRECGIQASSGDELAPYDVCRGMAEMWVTLG